MSNVALASRVTEWRLVPLGELGVWSGGGTPSKAKKHFWEGGNIPWVSPKDMKVGRLTSSIDQITATAVEESTAKLIPDGSILIVTRSGILQHSLPVATNAVPVTVNQDLKALTPNESVLPEYVAWALRSFAQEILRTCSKQGTTVNSIETKSLMRFEIPVAPLEQQHRIVTEIEKQFSRLDEAVASLKRVKANLKRYKAAVLKAAVEGKLTEKWRKQNPKVEPASKLLERILAERRAKWEEAELAKMKAKGKEPKDDKWKEKYVAPEAGNAVALSERPESWVLARLDQITEIKGGITIDSKRKSADFETLPYLRVANVQRGWIDVEKMKTIDVPVEKVESLLLEPGDILFNEGGDRDKLGRGWVWEGQIERCIYQNHVFRARLYVSQALEPKFVSWYGNGFGQAFFMSKGKQTTNLASINKTMLSSLPIPIPPAAEQVAIREQVDMEMARLDMMEESAEKSLIRVSRLRQSILAKAFSGDIEFPIATTVGCTLPQ